MSLELGLAGLGVAVLVWLGLDLLRSSKARRSDRAHLTGRAEEFGDPAPRPRSALERRLLGAGVPLSPLAFRSASLLLASLAYLTTLEFLPVPAAAFVVGVIALSFPHWLLSLLATWRARRFEIGLADAIDLMVSGLQAGESLPAAIAGAATYSGDAVRRELEEVVARLQVALPVERALARMASRFDSEGMRLFTQTLIAKWNAGGELSGVLLSVQRIIRERLRLRLHLQSQLAGHRASIVFVALFPYLVVPLFLTMRPQWVETLTSHPLGPPLLVGALVLQLVGLLWFRRMLAMEL